MLGTVGGAITGAGVLENKAGGNILSRTQGKNDMLSHRNPDQLENNKIIKINMLQYMDDIV